MDLDNNLNEIKKDAVLNIIFLDASVLKSFATKIVNCLFYR